MYLLKRQSEVKKMTYSMAYAKELYSDNIDGYIQIMQLQNGKANKVYNAKYDELWDILEQFKGQYDVYITPNTYYKPGRAVSYIRQLRALYIDIDLKKGKTINDAIQEVILLVFDNKIPMPSMFVDSGRGLHLYWRIEDAPYQALDTWQALEDYLYNKLKHIGADAKATDAARVLRLPSTKNSKNKKMCKVLHITEEKYSMYELREKYLGWSKQPNPKAQQLEFFQTKKQNKCKVKHLFNSYTLHMARINDLKTLCHMRDYDVKGYRNMILHCFAYWQGIYTRDMEQLEKEVIELNNAFKEPLKPNEVKAILKCVPKAIKKFLDWVDTNGKVTKGMKDKQGYWYTNKTLIERLGITPEEQKHLKTIIDTEEKRRRDYEKRRKNRRNEEGLTKKQVEVMELKNKIKKLKEEGYSYRAIANQLNISLGLVSYYAKQ